MRQNFVVPLILGTNEAWLHGDARLKQKLDILEMCDGCFTDQDADNLSNESRHAAIESLIHLLRDINASFWEKRGRSAARLCKVVLIPCDSLLADGLHALLSGTLCCLPQYPRGLVRLLNSDDFILW